MHTCKCLACGKEFESKVGSNYCSQKCYKKAYAAQRRQMTASLHMERKRLAGDTSPSKKKKKDPYAWLENINAEIRRNGGTYIKKQ